MVEAGGTTRIIHHSELLVRWMYKAEMELLLGADGFARDEVCGGNRRPLMQESDGIVVLVLAGE